MSLFSKLVNKVESDVSVLFDDSTTAQAKKSLAKSNLEVAVSQINDTVAAVTNRIIEDPLGVAESVIEDTKVALFGHNEINPVKDALNFVKGLGTLAVDNAMNVFNMLPSLQEAPSTDRQTNAINQDGGKFTIVESNMLGTGASIGDMSWLIYKARYVSNPEMTDKWQLYRDDETSHGFNSRTYVNANENQVVITLEGTQSNSDLSPLWVSKDGLADLEIGLGVIPPAMREGYEEFKEIVADVQNKYGSDYTISVAGHSLGGGLAQMIPGMYFIDTGVALPTLAEAGPGMLSQLKVYAEEQLLAGKTIHLPNGNAVSLESTTALARANEAKAIANTFKAQDFSFVTNLITVLDPVGAVNYDIDPEKDGHIGVNLIVPYLLTTREDMQDLESVVMSPVDSLNLVTPELTDKLGLGNISATRFDRHEPDQSIALWSGTAVGYKDPSVVGTGTAVYRSYLDPRYVWSGSNLGLSEVKAYGTDGDDTIDVQNEKVFADSTKATMVLAGDGNDAVRGGSGGDMLSGGNGDDTIFGGAGDDYIAGDAGNDYLFGDAGNDILYGGEGDDYMDGGADDDVLCGGAGNDTLIWGQGNDMLCGNEGDDTLVIDEGATGNTQMKWERNYTNFGNDKIVMGTMADDSSVLFNFADEIRMQDMRWSAKGDDIIMTDNLGTAAASVTFEDAFSAFASNDGKMEMQFTNGRLYEDDQLYKVVAGKGSITANADGDYAGSVMVGANNSNDTLIGGAGNDVMFGGTGNDTFVFGQTFGTDQVVGSNSGDKLQFDASFNAKEFTISQNNDDLVISYQQTGLSTSSSVTLVDYYASGSDHADTFQFGGSEGQNYKIEGTSFVKSK